MQIWGLVIYAFWIVVVLLILILVLVGAATWLVVRWLRRKRST